MEEFEKIWQEALDSYETIPDKSKIKEEDKEYARGFYVAIDYMNNIIHNYSFNEDLDKENTTTINKMKKEIIEDYDKYAKEFMEGELDDVITSILDSYVE